jgi:hypothetical protein
MFNIKNPNRLENEIAIINKATNAMVYELDRLSEKMIMIVERS